MTGPGGEDLQAALQRRNEGLSRKDEHFAWACKHWKGMDRDGDGFVTRPELDSEEFRNAIRSVLGAKGNTSSSGRDYSRFKINVEQAIDWVRRKADQNNDCSLSFKEFESFTRKIRRGDAQSTADMIFALFDLGGNDAIDKDEFREIYRYFLGRMPTRLEFEEEWARLDAKGEQEVSKTGYMRWLQTSPNPIFRRHASVVAVDTPETQASWAKLARPSSTPLQTVSEGQPRQKQKGQRPASNPWSSSRKKPLFQSKSADAVGMRIQMEQDRRYGGGFVEKGDRPEWNKRHHLGSNENLGKPRGQRTYFSRPQTVDELSRFFSSRQGYDQHLRKLQSPERKKMQMILSGEADAPMCQERHEPGGSMRSREGLTIFWNNHWQPTASEMWRYTPGTNTLRLPGFPPNLYQDD